MNILSHFHMAVTNTHIRMWKSFLYFLRGLLLLGFLLVFLTVEVFHVFLLLSLSSADTEEVLQTVWHDFVDKLASDGKGSIDLLRFHLGKDQAEDALSVFFEPLRDVSLNFACYSVLKDESLGDGASWEPFTITELEGYFEGLVGDVGGDVLNGDCDFLVGGWKLCLVEADQDSKPIRFDSFVILSKCLDLFEFNICEVLLRIGKQTVLDRFSVDDLAGLHKDMLTFCSTCLNCAMKEWWIFCTSAFSSSSRSLIWSKMCLRATATVRSGRGRPMMLYFSSFAAICCYDNI